MKLYDFILENFADYDVYDNTFDHCVTVCMDEPTPEDDLYDKFMHEICKRVDVLDTTGAERDGVLTADWTGLIKRNEDKFREVMKSHWKSQYEDEDDFLYQWIRELHYYFAGYVPDSFYKTLYDFALTLD